MDKLFHKWRIDFGMVDGRRVYRVRGRMLVSHDRLPQWVPFNLELTGYRVEDVVEKVYSNLGSKHKLRRKHIVIESIEAVESPVSKQIKDLLKLEGWVK